MKRSLTALACALLAVGTACSSRDTAEPGDGAPTSEAAVEVGTCEPAASSVDELLALGRPIVLAHASGENEHPHSSPFGYADAVDDGVDVLDIDVQLTADGVLIVHHDASVDRTTNAEGAVADMTYAEIAELDNAYWFTETCTCDGQPEDAYLYRGIRTGEVEPPAGYEPDDFAIARFSDIAKRFPSYVLNIEIKGEHPEALDTAQTLADELTELGRQDSAVVTSFDDQIVDAFAEMAPRVALTPGLGESGDYVLTNTMPADGRIILQLPKEYEGIEVVTAEFMDRVHNDGLVLWIWPNQRELENEAAYTEFLNIGVDGLNAAAPSDAVAAVKAYNESGGSK